MQVDTTARELADKSEKQLDKLMKRKRSPSSSRRMGLLAGGQAPPDQGAVAAGVKQVRVKVIARLQDRANFWSQMQNNHWAWLRMNGSTLTPEQLPGHIGELPDYPTAPWRAVAGCGLLQQEDQVYFVEFAWASWLGQQMAWQPIDEVNLAIASPKPNGWRAAARRRICLVTPASSVASISPERRVEGSCTKGLVDICSRLAMIQTPLCRQRREHGTSELATLHAGGGERPWHGGSGHGDLPLSAGPGEVYELASGDLDELASMRVATCHRMADFWRAMEEPAYELRYLKLASELVTALVPQCPNRACNPHQ